MSHPYANDMVLPTFVIVTKATDLGVNHDKPLPEGYTIEGFCFKQPKLGEPLQILRTKRQGIERLGIFTSSPIQGIEWKGSTPEQLKLRTQNSVYTLTVVHEGCAEAPTLAADMAALFSLTS